MRTSSDSYLLIVVLVALLVCPPPLLAAVIVVEGTCTLVDAITAANTDTATGGWIWPLPKAGVAVALPWFRVSPVSSGSLEVTE
jgi:hypothetical protein